jgi:hypothetical protein
MPMPLQELSSLSQIDREAVLSRYKNNHAISYSGGYANHGLLDRAPVASGLVPYDPLGDPIGTLKDIIKGGNDLAIYVPVVLQQNGNQWNIVKPVIGINSNADNRFSQAFHSFMNTPIGKGGMLWVDDKGLERSSYSMFQAKTTQDGYLEINLTCNRAMDFFGPLAKELGYGNSKEGVGKMLKDGLSIEYLGIPKNAKISHSVTILISIATNTPQSKAEQLAAAIAQIPQAAKLGNSKNTKGLSM